MSKYAKPTETWLYIDDAPVSPLTQIADRRWRDGTLSFGLPAPMMDDPPAALSGALTLVRGEQVLRIACLKWGVHGGSLLALAVSLGPPADPPEDPCAADEDWLVRDGRALGRVDEVAWDPRATHPGPYIEVVMGEAAWNALDFEPLACREVHCPRHTHCRVAHMATPVWREQGGPAIELVRLRQRLRLGWCPGAILAGEGRHRVLGRVTGITPIGRMSGG